MIKTQSTLPEQEDMIKFHEEGWKSRYYLEKLKIDISEKKEVVTEMCKSYAEGLSWVFQYYYHGCVSWSWYYPFHYSPFASDLTNLDEFAIEFQLSKPFSPIAQLMGVLPAASSHALPPKFAALMKDQHSEISDFYPVVFDCDLNGKRYTWQAVVLLPFIDEGMF